MSHNKTSLKCIRASEKQAIGQNLLLALKELQKEQLKRLGLESSLKVIEKDMENMATISEIKSKLLHDILNRLDHLLDEKEQLNRMSLKTMANEIRQQLGITKRHGTIHSITNHKDCQFEERLIEIHPNLTKGERTICPLIRSNFGIKEISTLKHTTIGSIKTMTYRIRQKLNVESTEQLYRYLNSMALSA